VLTAPDIDARVFRQLVPYIVPAAERITLYASSQDKALLASRRFNGEARAGDAGPGLVVMPGLQTIDATAVDTSLFGHSYFGENRTVLTDLFQVLRGAPIADRASDLRPARSAIGDYWEFRA
jgi:esterase/lipase superfamily enzyme